MTQESKFHPAVEMFKTEYENGEMNRREFMARATTLGVTAAGAYGLIGAVQPAFAPEVILRVAEHCGCKWK